MTEQHTDPASVSHRDPLARLAEVVGKMTPGKWGPGTLENSIAASVEVDVAVVSRRLGPVTPDQWDELLANAQGIAITHNVIEALIDVARMARAVIDDDSPCAKGALEDLLDALDAAITEALS